MVLWTQIVLSIKDKDRLMESLITEALTRHKRLQDEELLLCQIINILAVFLCTISLN